jgi:hypothetical protein
MWHRQEKRVVSVVKGACGTNMRREYLGWKPSRKSPFAERDIYGRKNVLKSGMTENRFFLSLSYILARALK